MKAFNRLVLAVIVFVVGFAVVIWAVVGDPISQTQWNRIQKGMTKDQVIQILGKPNSNDGKQLEYSRFMNIGWVEFAFDQQDKLVWKTTNQLLEVWNEKFILIQPALAPLATVR